MEEELSIITLLSSLSHTGAEGLTRIVTFPSLHTFPLPALPHPLVYFPPYLHTLVPFLSSLSYFSLLFPSSLLTLPSCPLPILTLTYLPLPIFFSSSHTHLLLIQHPFLALFTILSFLLLASIFLSRFSSYSLVTSAFPSSPPAPRTFLTHAATLFITTTAHTRLLM